MSEASEGLTKQDLEKVREGAQWAFVGEGRVVGGEVRSGRFFGRA